MKSVEIARDRMAAERNVSFGPRPLPAGGHGSNALSMPMREDSPAARITPAKLGARTIRFSTVVSGSGFESVQSYLAIRIFIPETMNCNKIEELRELANSLITSY